MSSTVGGSKSSTKYTPLPLAQISILLLLRFCEAASTFVIFPFLNEVRTKVLSLMTIGRPNKCVAPDFCSWWRWDESWVLRWFDGPSVDRLAFEKFHFYFLGCYSSTGIPCDSHVLESHV